jgi:hypothetical protein
LAEAEEAYRAASLAGRDPQPGLALLRLARGQADAAVATIRRVRNEASDAAARVRTLGSFVEIMLAAGDLDAARTGVDELAALAGEMDNAYVRAMAAYASGSVLLAQGNPSAALPLLRRAWVAWRGLEVPYEAARARVLIGLACRALGDRDGGEMELDAARLGFQVLGAVIDAARVEGLLGMRRDHGHGLSIRETEVVALVAKGRNEPGDRHSASDQRAHRRPARTEHFRQARRIVPHSGRLVRLRARSRRSGMARNHHTLITGWSIRAMRHGGRPRKHRGHGRFYGTGTHAGRSARH